MSWVVSTHVSQGDPAACDPARNDASVIVCATVRARRHMSTMKKDSDAPGAAASARSAKPPPRKCSPSGACRPVRPSPRRTSVKIVQRVDLLGVRGYRASASSIGREKSPSWVRAPQLGHASARRVRTPRRHQSSCRRCAGLHPCSARPTRSGPVWRTQCDPARYSDCRGDLRHVDDLHEPVTACAKLRNQELCHLEALVAASDGRFPRAVVHQHDSAPPLDDGGTSARIRSGPLDEPPKMPVVAIDVPRIGPTQRASAASEFRHFATGDAWTPALRQ